MKNEYEERTESEDKKDLLRKEGREFIEYIEEIMEKEGIERNALKWEKITSTQGLVKLSRVTELMSRIKNGQEKGVINTNFLKRLITVFGKYKDDIELKAKNYNTLYSEEFGTTNDPNLPSPVLLKLRDRYAPEGLGLPSKKGAVSIADYIETKNDAGLYRPLFCILYLIFTEAIGEYEHELIHLLNHNNRVETAYLKILKKEFKPFMLRETINFKLIKSNEVCSSLKSSTSFIRAWHNFLEEAGHPFEWSLGTPNTNKILIEFIPTGKIYTFRFSR